MAVLWQLTTDRQIEWKAIGWNEGKARYETLSKYGIQRLRAPLGAALLHEYWYLR